MKNINLYLITLIALILFIPSQTSISLVTDFTFQTKTDFYQLTLNLGTPPVRIQWFINTNFPYTRISPATYNPNNSSSGVLIKDELIKVEDQTSSFQMYQETVGIGESSIEEIKGFSFYLGVIPTHSWSDGFGFAYKFQDESFSIIHQLYKNGKISEKSFGLIPYRSDRKPGTGSIYLGEISDVILNDYRYNGSCLVSDDYIPWGCQISSLILNNKTYVFNQYAFFNTAQYHTIVSTKFFDFIYNNYFINWVDNEACLKIMISSVYYFRCYQVAVEMAGKISFQFNNKLTLIIPIIDLFTCSEELCESNFVSNADKNLFEFGSAFFKFFNATVFHYDKKAVFFYSDKDSVIFNHKPSTLNKIKFQQIVLGWVIIINIFGIIFIVLIKQKTFVH